MVVRTARAYTKMPRTNSTRKSKTKHLNYVKTVPVQNIVKFFMGDMSKFERGEFKNFIKIICCENVQIRDMALEATRQMIHNRMTKKFGENYYFACKCFPHQILRENKTFSGGSKGERVQSGMAHSFGTTMFRSAYVKSGEPIFVVGFDNIKDVPFIRNLCKSASPKLPCRKKIVFEQVK